MKYVSAILLSFLLVVNMQAQLTVTEVGTLPERVSNNAVCEGFIDGIPYLYSFAGIDSTKSFSGIHLKSFRINLETGESEYISDLPDDLGKIGVAASRIGNIIYIAGGYNVFANGAETTTRKMHRYDIANNEFLTDAADIPTPTDDHVQAVWQDSLIYLITGWNDTENIPDVQIYNPENDEWMMGTSVPDTDNYKSFGASGMIVDNTIYYFGGARSSGSFGIQNNLRMGTINPDNPSEIEWSVMTPSAFVTGYRMAATAIDDELHWIGGSNKTYNYDGIAYDGSGPVSPSNRNIFLSTSEFVWKQNGPFALPMDLRGIANVEKRVKYIAGGMMAGQEVTNKVFKLEWEGPTNTMENISSIALKIGPNPVEDILMVDSEAPQYKIEKIEIWDAMSKKHSILHFHQSEVQISLAHLPKGIYILHITVAGKIHTHQVVKI